MVSKEDLQVSYAADSQGSTAERFFKKIEPVTEAGCWIWVGAAGRYGNMTAFGRHMDAHRASWILHNGDVPDGMRVCHKCDVPLCVNPSHLFVATAKENTHDMIRKGRHRYRTFSGDQHWRWRQKNGI
jgi:hypothetical protein